MMDLGLGTNLWIEFSQVFVENELIGMPVVLTVTATYMLDEEMRELQTVINGTLELD